MQRGGGGVKAARLVSVVFTKGAAYPAICPSTSHPIKPKLPYLFAPIYNAHPKAPKDYLATNLRGAWAKADDYYSKLDDSPAYYAATTLHPYYKHYLDKVWSGKPNWIAANSSSFRALWVQYNTLPRAVSRDTNKQVNQSICLITDLIRVRARYHGPQSGL